MPNKTTIKTTKKKLNEKEIITEKIEKRIVGNSYFTRDYEYYYNYNKIKKKLKLSYDDKINKKKIDKYIKNIYDYMYIIGESLSYIEQCFTENSNEQIFYICDNIDKLKKEINKLNMLTFMFKKDYDFYINRQTIIYLNKLISNSNLDTESKKKLPNLKFYEISKKSSTLSRAKSLSIRKTKKSIKIRSI